MITDDFERERWAEGYAVYGIDEAGMGCLAGSMFVAGVIFNIGYDFTRKLSEVNDSKKLSALRRMALETEIKSEAKDWFCQQIGPEIVDRYTAYHSRLSRANLMMDDYHSSSRRLKESHPQKFCVLMDGNVKVPNVDTYAPSYCMVKGDAKSFTLAAASILAKCAKDREMIRIHEKHPEYDWSSNKGYGTKKHIAAIKKYGLTGWHRTTYCKKFVEES